MSDTGNLWPEGRYTGRVIGGSIGATAKGDPKFILDIEIDGHPKVVYLTWTDKSEPYVREKLELIGWNGKIEDEMAFANPEKVPLTCRHNNWDGKVSEQWDIYARAVRPLDDDRKRILAARYRASTAGVTRPSTTVPATPARAVAPTRPMAASPTPPKRDSLTISASSADEAYDKLRQAFPQLTESDWHKQVGAAEKHFTKTENDFGSVEWSWVVNTFIPI